MAIMLICNGLSALVGLGQVFRPQTFNPPFIPGVTDSQFEASEGSAASLTYKDDYGRTIIRPCGLSDMVGSAAGAGATAALIGLALLSAADWHVETAALPRPGVLRRGGDLLLASPANADDADHMFCCTHGDLLSAKELRVCDDDRLASARSWSSVR